MTAASVKTEPVKVKRKNLPAARRRSGPPQMPMMKNIGTSVSSKKM